MHSNSVEIDNGLWKIDLNGYKATLRETPILIISSLDGLKHYPQENQREELSKYNSFLAAVIEVMGKYQEKEIDGSCRDVWV